MAQFSRPDADENIGNWTDDGGGTTDIHDSIDETAASDSDYIESEADPADDACEIGLSTILDPEISTGHVMRYRYRKRESGGSATVDIDVELRQGVTTITIQSHSDVGTDWTQNEYTLSAGEADGITDYSDLGVTFTANKTAGAGTGYGGISWFELEVAEMGGVDSSAKIMSLT